LQPDAQYIIVPEGEMWLYSEGISVVGLEGFLMLNVGLLMLD